MKNLFLLISGGYADDNGFVNESEYSRGQFNKRTGQVDEAGDPVERPEGDFFEAVDAGQGEQFMAVKPWIGAVVEPQNRKHWQL